MLFDQKILNQLNEIGIALSKEQNITVLLEKILINAKELTHADGGTVYTVTPEGTLHFEIIMSDTLKYHHGGTSENLIPFANLPLFLEDGSKNDSLMVAYAVNHKVTINIQDAYHEKGFDFSGTREFDASTGYRTRAVLTIPIKNHEDDVIAVLQLINPVDKKIQEVTTFSYEDEQLAESLASQAGVALTNQLLIANLRKLFESLIRVIAEAIDEKSPSTGNHGKRVPIVAVMLAEAINAIREGPFKDVHFTDDELYELEVAAFLHDCGKITTPEYVVEKKHKLETIFDRIEMIDERYLTLFEKIEKELLEKKLRWMESHFPKEFATGREAFLEFEKEYRKKTEQYIEERDFIRRCNAGIEEMNENTIEHIHRIATSGLSLLKGDEIENLCVVRGNLTEKEREIIKHHVVMTYRMLSQLNYPKELRNVPEIAASHHERVDGRGYPRGLKKEQMSIRARILAIADVFEALSAPDRPYKKALPLSQVFKIMQEMVDEGHLDPDLFNVFLKRKAYLPYARQYLTSDQLDIE